LLKIATRGVVKLFNAVNKQQKILKADNEESKPIPKVENLSKAKFLELLQTSGTST